MARQDNPFALLGEDDDGADVSVLVAKVEAKISMSPAPVPEQPKQKTGTDGFPSKPSPPSEYVRGERGRGRGSRGRGLGRGGLGNVGDSDAIEQPENGYARGYSGEYGGVRGRGRGGRGRGRGRGFGGFGESQLDYEKLGEGGNGGADSQEKGYYGQRRPFRSESRKFGDDNQEQNGEERENRGFRGYGADRENRGFRAYGADRQNQDGRDGEIRERSYGGDGESRGFRGGEGRGRGYGGRGRRGGRDGGRFGSQYESNEGWNASETKEVAAEAIEQTVNNTNNGDVSTGWDSPIATEEPKNVQSEKPVLEQKASEDAAKVPEEDNEMTLAEYEKVLHEKRKALESLKTEARKVVLDKEFEGMQLMEKKKEEELFIKKSEKDKGKKKETAEKEEKSRKPLSINEFLKPADGERFRAPPASSRGRGGRGRGGGGYRGIYPSHPSQAAPAIEDPGQFPILGAVAKA